MRIEVGAPVIVVQVAGLGDGNLYYLPVRETRPRRGVDARRRSFEQRWLQAGLPDEWPTLCGLAGGIYSFAGGIRQRKLCTVCLKHAPDDIVVPGRGPLPDRSEEQKAELFWARSRLTPAHARALHAVYVRDGVGIPRLAEQVYERLGYRTANGCASAIRNAFQMLGLEIRAQAEGQRARAAAMRRHGFGGRGYDRRLTPETVDRLWALYEAGHSSHEISRRFHERLGFESWERLRNAVEYAWRVQGRRLRSPREATLLANARATRRCKGIRDPKDGTPPRPCMQKPAKGSDYCFGHDPARKGERDALIAKMQARIRRPDTIAWALVRPHLGPLLEPRPDPRGRPRTYETASGALARRTGVDPAICSRLLKGRQERITVRRANELLAPLGLSAADLVPERAAA